MPNLLCTNDKDCTGIIKGLMYNVRLDGDYAVCNGNRYRADRFEELHKPTPPEVYMDILNLGKVNKVLVNEINNEINKKGGLTTYETDNIQTCSIESQLRLRTESSAPVHYRRSSNILMRGLRKLLDKITNRGVK